MAWGTRLNWIQLSTISDFIWKRLGEEELIIESNDKLSIKFLDKYGALGDLLRISCPNEEMEGLQNPSHCSSLSCQMTSLKETSLSKLICSISFHWQHQVLTRMWSNQNAHTLLMGIQNNQSLWKTVWQYWGGRNFPLPF